MAEAAELRATPARRSATAPAGLAMLSDKEFQQFSGLIYRIAGIGMSPDQSRASRVMPRRVR